MHDSLTLVNNSKNLSTVLERYNTLIEALTWLAKNENDPLFTFPNEYELPSVLLEIIPSQRTDTINEAIQRAYENALEKSLLLKTENGRNRRIRSFFTMLDDLFPTLPTKCQLCISSLKMKHYGQESEKKSTTSSSGMNTNQKTIALTPLEIAFLDFLHKKEDNYRIFYWQELEKQGLKGSVEKFFSLGLLAYASDFEYLNIITNVELKALLKALNLPQTGNKAELIKKITQTCDFEKYITKKYYYVTIEGKKLIDENQHYLILHNEFSSYQIEFDLTLEMMEQLNTTDTFAIGTKILETRRNYYLKNSLLGLYRNNTRYLALLYLKNNKKNEGVDYTIAVYHLDMLMEDTLNAQYEGYSNYDFQISQYVTELRAFLKEREIELRFQQYKFIIKTHLDKQFHVHTKRYYYFLENGFFDGP